MDCLTEANKVSTLARRRENPKALFADAAMGIGKASPRGFLDAPSVMLSAAQRPAGPEPRALWNPGGHLPEPGLAKVLYASAGLMGGPREFGMKMPTGGRLVGADRPAKRAPVYQTTLTGRDQKLRKVAPGASMGNAFRVSARVGFRLPGPGAPGRNFAATERGGLPETNGLRATAREVPLIAPERAAVVGRAGSRLAFGEMGFTGAPDAPAPVEWVGLVARKGFGRELEIS
jgi:hypothetical protein